MKGDNTVNHFGNYGPLAVKITTNKPGARTAAATWKDATGNLWLFGGSGYATGTQGYLNDLWKYEPATGMWAWIKGDNTTGQFGTYGTQAVEDAANKPGATYSGISWTDAQGNLWLFGGFGYSSTDMGLLNALWKYNPASNQWVWMKGDNNVNSNGTYGTQGSANNANAPGARYSSQAWTDAAGNLWLFGGFGYAATGAGILNDLWKFNTSTNQWIWVNGNNTANNVAIYGTKGLTAATNKPGGRYVSAGWQDEAGNVWIFGGYGFDETYAGNLNDMWKYNPSINQWTWMSGDKLRDQKAVFGTQGEAAPTYKPGSRIVGSAWKDAGGGLCMFGGYGFDAINSGYLNDLWRYNTSTNQWTWVKGDNTVDQRGVYGTMGMPDASNKSGARTGSVSWSDGSGNLWLFGGTGYDGNTSGVLNDLWKINGAQVILPLQLLDFSGIWNTTVLQLKWKAEIENDFSHFNVLRSFDGINFHTIGDVSGSGSTGITNYNYADYDLKNHPAQSVFYRLQMIDNNGHFVFSKIIRFNLKQATGTITAYPNPASISLNISFEQKKPGFTSIAITDINGKLVKKQTQNLPEGKASLGIDVSALTPGVYILSVTNADGALQQSFIKE